ncbi:NAD-dependent epimerase/dehydratase family protein [Aquabacterium sp. J223]|uniref:NAD-dependent epimerase/dehydratase family protein n=1 Tax=Aquabacterium sp. J223 TaxID=2898431 RepID=UPI0021ADC437|nr:NAD-dependent epimerase/dehydratase family protein [Aquabacterium sp. J223]UUX95123.1 NAD-dependent epimerase/dehydratase family protein [Aquabacterium sp. J223]
MHLLITGADGFVGRSLVRRLLGPDGDGVASLTLMDLRLSPVVAAAPTVRPLPGSLADAGRLEAAFERPVDAVVHLASVPGGAAERQYALARDVNLHGTLALLERCKAQVEAGGVAPVFVFASTVAVFGRPQGPVDDHTPPDPQLSYGMHKLVGEAMVADFSRRGWVDGRSLRLPGVLARPAEPTGQWSAFLSDLIHELGAGRPFTCPTSPQAVTWASSVRNVVDNLLHGLRVHAAALQGRRTLTLPTQVFSLQALVQAVGRVHGTPAEALVRWQPDERIESLFGRFPPLRTPQALAAGFRADADLDALVRDAVERSAG